MRSLTFVFAAALVLAAPTFATAAPDGKVLCIIPDAKSVSPTDAAEALRASLPSGVTMGTASEEQLLAAYKDAAGQHEGYGGALAALLAAGRPDVVAALSETVKEICPSAAEVIIKEIDESASNPNPDQLAAIATTEGGAPAAGPEGGQDNNGSNQ